jgi:hypothetical protein
LGKFATVFQTKIYAILQYACENIGSTYKHKQILIFSDSQAALKALGNLKVTSELVAECLDALSVLASLNEVTLMWVPGHSSIPGNEEADELARQASAMPLLGPELALGTPCAQQKKQLRTGPSINIILPGKIYQSSTWQIFISRPCKTRAENLLKLSRHQLKNGSYSHHGSCSCEEAPAFYGPG